MTGRRQAKTVTENFKKQALSIVQQRNLCSYMNDTKWNELRWAMLNDMPFPPPYIMKTLFETECYEEKNFQEDTYFNGDWYDGFAYSESFKGNFSIEWIKVRPRMLKHRGRLIAPEVIDESAEFEDVLRKYNIPYEKQNDVYCIYGYK